jgi:hypothetical protein
MSDPGPETDDRHARLRALSDQQLDERAGDAWTLRQLAFHLGGSAFYADSVGMLGG